MEAFFVSALVVAISEIADKTQLLSLLQRRAVRRRAFRPRRQRAARCDSSQGLALRRGGSLRRARRRNGIWDSARTRI